MLKREPFEQSDGSNVVVESQIRELSPDGGWVALAKSGERAAQSQLYRRHSKRLLGLAIRLLRDHGEAEDLVHDVFLIAFSKLEQLKEQHKFGGWISSILVRRAQHRLRRRKLKEVLFFSPTQGRDGFLESLLTSDASPEHMAELRAFERNLRQFAAAERSAWILRHVEGYKLTEIAELMDISLATVKRKVASAEEKVENWAHASHGQELTPAASRKTASSGVYPAANSDREEVRRTGHA